MSPGTSLRITVLLLCIAAPEGSERRLPSCAHGGEDPEHRHGQGLAKNNWPPAAPGTATRPGEESLRSADPRKFPGEQLAVSMAALLGLTDRSRLFPVI